MGPPALRIARFVATPLSGWRGIRNIRIVGVDAMNPNAATGASKQQVHGEKQNRDESEERTMNRPEPRRFQPAFAAAAVLVSTLVLGLAVLVPVKLAPPPDARVLARLPVEVAIVPSRIEVVGVRSERTAHNDGATAEATPKS